MPSQRVVGAVTSLVHGGGAKFSYSVPGCTPQAHCRSESLLSYAMTDMESWFPASGLSEMTGGGASPAVSQNFQRPSEKPLGGNVDDEVASAAGITTAGLLSEYQTDTWWPSIIVNARDHRSSQQDGVSDNKPASTFTSCSVEAWCNTNNPVAVANVDLNTPSCCELPSAIAVVSVAPDALVSRTKGRKVNSTKGKSFSAPTSPSELRKSKGLGVQKVTWNGKRPVSQRENHIWSERQRRKGMNYLFSTLRSLLPYPTSKTDKSTVVGEIIKYIQSLQVKLEILTKKRQHVMAARTLNTFHGDAAPKAFVSNGLTLVDHSSDPACMTAITAMPLPGSESGLQSYLGSNVGLHVCGLNVFITISSPRGRRGLLQQLLVTIHKHDLDVINANISTSNASVFHYIHCQASPDEELLNNALHGDLQSMITNFEAPF